MANPTPEGQEIPDLPFAKGTCFNIPDHEYFSNSWHNGGDYLSNSCLKDFIRSPYILEQTRNGIMPPKSGDALRLGRVTHEYVLEKRKDYVLAPAKFMTGSGALSKSAEAKKWIAKQNLPIVTEDEEQTIEAMHGAVHDHRAAAGLLEDSLFEIVLRYEGAVWRQCKVDIINPQRRFLADLKTCNDINDFLYDMKKFNYLLQATFYRDMVRQITGETWGFYFIAVEKRLPFRVRVVQIAPEVMDKRDSFLSAQINLFSTYAREGRWPTGFEGIEYFDEGSF